MQAAATDSRHVKRAAITGSGRPLQAALLTNGKTKEMRGTFQVDLGGEEYVEGSENYGSAAKLFEDKEGNDDVDDNERIFDKLAAHVSAIKTVRALQYVEKIVDKQKKADADYELKYSAAKAANENRPPREANPVLEAKRNKIKSTDALCAKRVVVSSTLNCNCEARRVWVSMSVIGQPICPIKNR